MKKVLAVFNLLSAILVIAVNYTSQIVTFNGVTIGEMSRRYDTLFTPSGYAFSIWGIIFLLLLAYGIYQVKCAYSNNDESKIIAQTGPWFIIANLLNCFWVIVFSYDYTGISVLVMLGLLYSLVKIIVNTNMERTNAPLGRTTFLWIPIGIYAGWISVATIANIAIYLSKIRWEGGLLAPTTWCLIMIIVAVILNIIMVYKRNMKDFALVGVWALFAIYIRHKLDLEHIAYSALAGSIIIFITILVLTLRTKETMSIKKSADNL